MKLGKYICFEGSDYSGKSTVATTIVDWLATHGVKALYTRHPGSTPIGAELRKVIKESTNKIDKNTEALIMAADNSAFLSQLLIPAINEGTWVVADRNNFISSMAYQVASGLSLEHLDRVHNATCETIPKMDMLFVMRITADTYVRRANVRQDTKRDNFENRGNEYRTKVINAYDSLIEVQTQRLMKFVKPTECGFVNTPNVLYVDANRPINQVFESVTEAMTQLLDK